MAGAAQQKAGEVYNSAKDTIVGKVWPADGADCT